MGIDRCRSADEVRRRDGAGDPAFSAGGDLDRAEELVGNPEQAGKVMKEASDIDCHMEAGEKPIVSAINGTATAQIATACSRETLTVVVARFDADRVRLGPCARGSDR